MKLLIIVLGMFFFSYAHAEFGSPVLCEKANQKLKTISVEHCHLWTNGQLQYLMGVGYSKRYGMSFFVYEVSESGKLSPSFLDTGRGQDLLPMSYKGKKMKFVIRENPKNKKEVEIIFATLSGIATGFLSVYRFHPEKRRLKHMSPTFSDQSVARDNFVFYPTKRPKISKSSMWLPYGEGGQKYVWAGRKLVAK